MSLLAKSLLIARLAFYGLALAVLLKTFLFPPAPYWLIWALIVVLPIYAVLSVINFLARKNHGQGS